MCGTRIRHEASKLSGAGSLPPGPGGGGPPSGPGPGGQERPAGAALRRVGSEGAAVAIMSIQVNTIINGVLFGCNGGELF